MIPALKVRELEWAFDEAPWTKGGFRLGPVDLEIETGTVIGIVGPNGSGKSTLLHCLSGFLKPKKKVIEIGGEGVEFASGEWKKKIGYAGESSRFFERWSSKKNLELVSSFYPDWSDDRSVNLAERLKLDLTKPVYTLSRGNRMKLALISALAFSPELLLFDEPADGLDPAVRAEMIVCLRELMAQGNHTIIFATHHVEEFASLVDELIFIRSGKIEWRSKIDELADNWAMITFKSDKKEGLFDGVVDHQSEGFDHRLISNHRDKTILHLKKSGIEDIHVSRLDLDEIMKWIVKGEQHVASD